MSDQSIQRRLAAILAADVAGYTRLMEVDSDGTVAAWQAAREAVIRPTVDEYSGKIVKLTGDGFLVEFPTVQDAVNCAIAMQAGLSDNSLDFRIGVNLGDIIDDGEDIHGEGVNVADRLEGLADPGGICISGMVYESIRNRIEADFEDMGEQEVKNVSAPVRAYRIRIAGVAEAALDDAISSRPSIAVLPLDNLFGEEAQEYVSDGISEDIITQVTRSRWLRVVARNSSFSYKGQSPDIRTVSRELDARYVLEGSVRKAGGRVRISVQLIDGASGDHIWAERYDRELEDIFAVQDEITETVAAAMEPELEIAERRRASSKNPANLDAWDLYHQGTAAYYKRDKANLARAIGLLQQSVERDPDFCRAWAGLTEALFLSVILNFSDDKDRDVDRMVEAAGNAVRADNDDHAAHEALGRAYLWQKKYGEALSEYEKALTLNSVSGRGRYGYAVAFLHSGDPVRAETELNAAIQLSPRDPNRSAFYARMAYCQIALGNFTSAVDWARKSISEPFTDPSVYWFLVSALGHLERTAEMKDAVNELFARIPDVSLDDVREQLPSVPETIDPLLEGLRKAGIPEGGMAARGCAAVCGQTVHCSPALRQSFRRRGAGIFLRRHGRGSDYRFVQNPRLVGGRPQFLVLVQGPDARCARGGGKAGRQVCARRQRPQDGRASAHQCPVDKCG